MVANYLASATADVAPVVSDVGVAAPAKDAGALAAITTSDVNLRTGPSEADPVILVLPQGASVETTGGPENGFYPVSYNRQPGWTAAAYLSFQEIPSDGPPPPPLAAPVADAGIGWPFRGGLWHVIQGYNNGTHTNRSAFAQYKYSLDWARVDGETAGQAVYAPASGTIEWLDRGSGGMLINMGNGYSIAMFHVTYSGMIPGQTVERGQQVGTISGPGGDGYAATAHVDLTLWQYTDGGHVSTPFIGPNAIAGMEFPDLGGANQHMGVEVTA
jgi:murein DD-endopeptidase MepM/ murein hydrolase activator NlpD